MIQHTHTHAAVAESLPVEWDANREKTIKKFVRFQG